MIDSTTSSTGARGGLREHPANGALDDVDALDGPRTGSSRSSIRGDATETVRERIRPFVVGADQDQPQIEERRVDDPAEAVLANRNASITAGLSGRRQDDDLVGAGTHRRGGVTVVDADDPTTNPRGSQLRDLLDEIPLGPRLDPLRQLPRRAEGPRGCIAPLQPDQAGGTDLRRETIGVLGDPEAGHDREVAAEPQW